MRFLNDLTRRAGAGMTIYLQQKTSRKGRFHVGCFTWTVRALKHCASFAVKAQELRWLPPLSHRNRQYHAGCSPNRLVLHLRINQPLKKPPFGGSLVAASPGLEPRLTESESAVLPLDDEAIVMCLYRLKKVPCQLFSLCVCA